MDICILCRSREKDELQYGDFLTKKNIGVHTFCLYLSSNLSQNGNDDEGFLGFLEADIKDEVRRISLLNCFYCHKPYANIGCCQTKCRKTFHLICGIKNFCENRFSHDFRSYCNKHVRKVQHRPSLKETCLICFDNIFNIKNFHHSTIIQTPCCRNGWFHKLCLQKFAKTSGYFFKCPLCNDSKVFREKLPSKGIFIPNQDAAWELEPNAFAELLERPSECAALKCENRRGRKVENPNNPFVMCSTCGSTAMHRQCIPSGGNRFHCADCTIAIEDADSGRESLNSQQNHRNDIENDDEIVVDVCNVSDKEDLEIVQGLIDNSSNKEPETSKYNTRDSGLSQDQNETHRQMSRCKTRHVISETESSVERPRREERSKHSRNTKTNLFRKHNRIINYSSSSEEEEEKILPKTKRLRNRDSISSDDIIVIKSGKKRTLTIESDADDQQLAHKIKRSEEENFQNRPSTSKNCEKSNFIDDDSNDDDDEIYKSKNISIISIGSTGSDSDDPLESFTKTVNEQKNISCIALRTRRKSQYLEKSQDNEINSLTNKAYLTNQTNDMKSTTNEEHFKIPQNLKTTIQADNKNQPENIQTKSVICKKDVQKPKHTNEKSKSGRFKPLKDETNTNALDISCIARRTRRKSMICMRSNSRQEKENQKETATTSSLNVSCIAVRTRRRTICAQSAKEHFKMSQVYEKFEDFETEEIEDELEIITEEDEEEDEEFVDYTSENEENVESEEEMDMNDFIVSDGYEEKDINFDISCIANRTRKRNSLKARLQQIDETNDTETSISTTSSTSASSNSSHSSLSSSPNDSLSNVKLSKRCSKRFLYTLSDKSSPSPSPPYESPHYTSKSKISPSRLIEKFPQPNYSAFLNTKPVSSKSSCSSAHNYYPNNQYHPHSNNRKRI